MTTATATAAARDDAAPVELTAPSDSQRGAMARRVLLTYEKLASIVIGAILLASGVLHVENPYYFLSSVYSYEITDPRLGEAIAIVLPVTQITVAACLLGRVFVGGALLVSAAVSSLFVAAQSVGLWRELNIDCGCFGPAYAQSMGTLSLLLACSVLLLAISAYLAWRFAPSR